MPTVFSQNLKYIDWEKLLKTNWDRLRRLMKERDIDSLIVNDIHNVKYLTGYSPFYCLFMLNTQAVVFPRDAECPTLFPVDFYMDFTPKRYPWLKDGRPAPKRHKDWPKAFAQLELGDRVGVDSAMMYELGKLLEKELKAEVVLAEDVLQEVRSVKNEEEVKVMDIATAIAEIGMRRAIDVCDEGMREYEVAAEISYAVRMAGAEAATHTLVTSGENAAMMQELSTDKIIRRGELVIIDTGAIYEGYNSEFARTVPVGRPTEEQRHIMEIVYEAEQSAIKLIKPGAKVADVDKEARRVIREAGYGQYEFTYNVGHGIGIALWEKPIIESESEDVFKENMFVCVEPAIYKPGVGGARIEDVVQVTSTGYKILTRTEYLI